MNPHPVFPSEDDLSLDSDERTLVVQSHHLQGELSALREASALGATDTSALDADNLFNADNDVAASDMAGSDVLRFDRRSGGVVTGEGASTEAVSPSGNPIARPRRRRWVVATLACISALALAALSALYADTIASRVSAELRPWLVAHGVSGNQR
ncbi:MAG TPA: hypothetical protein VFZ61_21430 [Polyangiales bacterium]